MVQNGPKLLRKRKLLRAEIDTYLNVQHEIFEKRDTEAFEIWGNQGSCSCSCGVVVVVADALLKECEGTLGRARSCC